ncbi:MAG: FAD-binding oxidoreductase [Spirochaetales bacterium]|nr:FAD-binding oxidoreductase [Spirochaetales bacterium]
MKLNFHRVIPDYADYLKDESRLLGQAETISFPVSEDEIRYTLSLLYSQETPVTVQGGRTGITGGSVPEGGHILNLSRMTKILGIRYNSLKNRYVLKIQPGVLLDNINNILVSAKTDIKNWDRESLKVWEKFCRENRNAHFFFPPNPTETTASAGGMAANNASGSRSYLYGSVRSHIEGLRLILADGSAVALKRGQNIAEGLKFNLKTDSGKVIRGELPNYVMPHIKNAAGLYAEKNMDLTDLFIGSEGTLAVITELELLISPIPPVVWGFMVFLPDERGVIELVRSLRGETDSANIFSEPAAIEYFDRNSLKLLENNNLQNASFKRLPEVRLKDVCAVYTEFHVNSEKEMENIAWSVIRLTEKAGGNSDEIWAASNPDELKRLKDFRHAVPEMVNMAIEKRRQKIAGITKLGTDMAVPDASLGTVMEMYNKDLDNLGFNYVKFGHIGNNHIHVNIIPESKDEYRTGKELHSEWAEKIVSMQGTVSAEHGIGKLKTGLLKIMYGEEGLKQMKKVKSLLDPKRLLNSGNDFDNLL